MVLTVQKFVSVVAAISLMAATPVWAADAVSPPALPGSAAEAALAATKPAPPNNQGPLPAAQAAGVKQAQAVGLDEIPWVFIVGGSLVLAAVFLGLTHDEGTIDTTQTGGTN
jgi:hypothetical protein